MKTSIRSVLTLFTFVCLTAVGPGARALLPPPAPDGGYPGSNTAEGDNALFQLTTGNQNTATGNTALFSNTTGGLNTATGAGALANNTTGNNNTANGAVALFSNTTGATNTANGVNALGNNTTGNSNTANGFNALASNTTGADNTATGVNVLVVNTTGSSNTANGFNALSLNTTGFQNTATGLGALQGNTTGHRNTADGDGALGSNIIGINNTAAGFQALLNSTGSNNIGLGASAGLNLTTGSNNIDIGNVGVAAEANTIRVGKVGTQQATFIAAISGKAVPGGVSVIVGANGHLGTVVSSQRFKTAIKPMEQASEAILALKPVTFRYKHELDPEGIPQFGLVAEDVEKVNPALVARDDQGKVYTVRYEAVNAMLLNEFLKEHRRVEEQQATITQLKQDFQSKLAEQQNQIEALISGLEKVGNQLELSKSAPQIVLNNR